MSAEIKPCPLCDGSPLLNPGPYDWDCGGRYYYSASIECACGLTLEVDNPGPKVYTDDDGEALGFAIDAWNKRAERTCKFVSSRDPHRPPACSACGHELDLYECEWFEDGTYGYGGNYCPHCGAKVVGSDEAKEV